MEPVEFESLSRSVVRRLAFSLRQKEQFKSSGQIQRALELEDELYKKVNNVRGAGDQYAEMWNDTHGVRLYTQTTEELIEKITNENGPYWRRVESGTITANHILSKFCPTMKVVPKPKKKRAASEAVLDSSVIDQQQQPTVAEAGVSAVPVDGNTEEPPRKKHKKEKKHKKHKKKHKKSHKEDSPVAEAAAAIEAPAASDSVEAVAEPPQV